ncbi:hypothetical protein CcaverHIS002_0311360 [Cutaneotrichosporon cavernicola]|uniref:Ribosomal protein S2 n=1 Tax=Cutaneotrichosporon cavernicola TaxID=279322 RepID=A0AA48QV80_9TREE|nr:uncharacterized protein CcaverHIS019_0311220 [Cutaneotrichosporon cavernicola]BEI83268.1 hypothetical protein CcaverHIS002_0311360 [Cutaneotrichosporon cavernicola]BEI91052.1 hypothetical protein CcaverHIS019_0311220 [Cutaneotrichosporon cavernicola]BEI98830.1 hypothetical protein CcaverHIS631_0311290 [Cutaneotrichosporon cavernicola]BEJ06603.1 hypothetical protein CcaverHIS641_0311250 [Cutaneotrichosporon cavernicola]
MKPTSCATTGALRALTAAPRQAARFSTTAAVSGPSYTQQPGESKAAAWSRNMDEVRDWRRRQAETDAQVSLYLPPGVETPRSVSPREASISTLLAAGAALGHKKSIMHPAYLPFVYGNRAGLNIIDLDQTLSILRRCASVVRDVVKDDGVVLFVSKQRNATLKIKGRMGDNGFVTASWMPGLLTNSETYFGMEPIMKGTYLPDLVIFSSPANNIGAIRECTMRKVPTMGIVDSNMDPRIVTYAIPANAASVRTAELVLGTLSLAGQEGRRLRVRDEEKASLRKSRDSEWRRNLRTNQRDEEEQ